MVRPTSETIIWHSFAKWIQSHRDLPHLANQWANVLRWEMRPRPFLRSAEFLWQEGHTAHADADSAKRHSNDILNTAYAPLCRDLLALPFYSGTKSATERFRFALIVDSGRTLVTTFAAAPTKRCAWRRSCRTAGRYRLRHLTF